MSLTKDTPIERKLGDFNSIKAGADEVIYEGSMVGESDGTSGRATAGYGEALQAGDTFMGHALEGVDNTDGSDGDKEIKVRRYRYVCEVTLTGVAISDVGSNVYASDDATLTLTAGSNSQVGVVHRYISANLCEVEFRPVAN